MDPTVPDYSWIPVVVLAVLLLVNMLMRQRG